MDMNPASKKVTPSAAIPPPVASAMLPGPTAGVEREYRCYDTALMYSPLPWVARTLRSSFLGAQQAAWWEGSHEEDH